MIGKKRIFIKVILSVIVMFTIISNYSSVNAESLLNKMMGDISSFKSAAEQSGTTINTDDVTKDFVDLGQILTMVGAGVMVAVTTYMGIRYLTEGPEAQAKLKSQLIGLVVSGIVIFGAYFIWKITINVVSTFGQGSAS